MYKRIGPTKGFSIKLTEPSLMEAENTYQKGILPDIDNRKHPTQMEERSMLSDHVKCVQHDETDTLYHLSFDSFNYCLNEDLYKELKEKEMFKTSKDFSSISEKLKSDYLDVYDAVYTEIVNTNRFGEDIDLSTTYLGQVDM